MNFRIANDAKMESGSEIEIKKKIQNFYKGLVSVFFVLVILSPVQKLTSDPLRVLLGPSMDHIFGFDNLGRDLFLKVILATKFSLAIGGLAAFLTIALSLTTVVAVHLIPRLRWLADLAIEWLSAFPSLLLGMLVMVRLSSFRSVSVLASVSAIAVAFALSHWMFTLRLFFQTADQIKKASFFESAISLGASRFHLFTRHILPSLIGLLKLQFFVLFSSAIMFESGLGFLGFGLQTPNATLGGLLQEGWRSLSVSPHLLWAPALVLMICLWLCQWSLQTWFSQNTSTLDFD